jgi:hypothetical protein
MSDFEHGWKRVGVQTFVLFAGSEVKPDANRVMLALFCKQATFSHTSIEEQKTSSEKLVQQHACIIKTTGMQALYLTACIIQHKHARYKRKMDGNRTAVL